MNSAVAMGRAKAYLAENADDSDEVPFDEFVDEVFDDEAPVAVSSKQPPTSSLAKACTWSVTWPNASAATTRSSPTRASC